MRVSIFALLILCLTQFSCSTQKEKSGPELESANKVLGLTKAEVIEKLGPPSDQRSGRYFWYLSSGRAGSEFGEYLGMYAREIGGKHSTLDSRYSSNANSKLYEFVFINDRLVRIKPSK